MTKVISIILLVTGILLLLVGALFRLMHWPDMFSGLITGPLFILFGILLLLIQRKKGAGQ